MDISDEFEPSWLKLKDFQLCSTQLVAFFTSARNQKLAENEPKFDSQLKTYFLVNFHNKVIFFLLESYSNGWTSLKILFVRDAKYP